MQLVNAMKLVFVCGGVKRQTMAELKCVYMVCGELCVTTGGTPERLPLFVDSLDMMDVSITRLYSVTFVALMFVFA